jgi:hypothetical protein
MWWFVRGLGMRSVMRGQGWFLLMEQHIIIIWGKSVLVRDLWRSERRFWSGYMRLGGANYCAGFHHMTKGNCEMDFDVFMNTVMRQECTI